ncbi:MAG: acetate--CoA ligase family protein, partial [Ilumatobacteraceae bacterium]
MASPGRTLSEADSKELISGFGVRVPDERVAANVDEAVEAATGIGLPVVLKLMGDAIAHKTERGLVRLQLGDEAAVRQAAEELLALATPEDGEVALLVAPMVRGNRELIAGVVRDPIFGPMVMLGVGGVLAEAIGDVAFRPAPLDHAAALDQIASLDSQVLLGSFRGEAAVDRHALADTLVGLGRICDERPDIVSVDLNPLIVTSDGSAVAVDALVELDGAGSPVPAGDGAAGTGDRDFSAL